MKPDTDVDLKIAGPWPPGRLLRDRTARPGERPWPSNVTWRASRAEGKR